MSKTVTVELTEEEVRLLSWCYSTWDNTEYVPKEDTFIHVKLRNAMDEFIKP